MFLQLLISGLALSSIYILVAVGLTIIWKTTDVVNFAHGEIFMFGALFGYLFLILSDLNYGLSVVLSILCAGLTGIILERLIFCHLMKFHHVIPVMATVGLLFFLRGVARFILGTDYYTFPPIATGVLQMAGLVITVQYVLIFSISLILMTLFFFFFKYAKLGKMMRATYMNPIGATLMGINTKRIYTLIWGLGCMVGGAAGILAVPVTLLTPEMGANILIKAFAACVVGGFGSIGGAIFGGFLIGVVENLIGAYVHSDLLNLSSFIIIIGVLCVRPQGVFGQKVLIKV
jgi:branched-chain amino acid transport system permease protein